jgi:hypothetical protein
MNDAGTRALLERALPVLKNKDYTVTSPKTTQYNCIAWAAEDDTRWWQVPTPMPIGGYKFYWPPELSQVHSLDNYVKAFETRGYMVCADDPSQEARVEKIVLYAWPGDDGCSHAARQLTSGLWVSKCGKLHDIEHATPYDITGGPGVGYGDVVRFMSRPRSDASTETPSWRKQLT